MLGPLPTRYRVVVSAWVLAACIGLGAWAAYMLPGPMLAPAGAGIGAVVGLVAALLLLAGPSPAPSAEVGHPPA